MAGSSCSFLLLLLLPFFIFHQLSSAPTPPNEPNPICEIWKNTREFGQQLNLLEAEVKNYNQTCNKAGHRTLECSCLNLNLTLIVASQQTRPFPEYFISGLKYMSSTCPRWFDSETILHVVSFLDSTNKCSVVKEVFRRLTVTYEPIVSPTKLHCKLNDLFQMFNDYRS